MKPVSLDSYDSPKPQSERERVLMRMKREHTNRLQGLHGSDIARTRHRELQEPLCPRCRGAG